MAASNTTKTQTTNAMIEGNKLEILTVFFAIIRNDHPNESSVFFLVFALRSFVCLYHPLVNSNVVRHCARMQIRIVKSEANT